jgi:UDP:flavonoid glycosyltransferase YjiC (YdhE family)
MLLNVEHLFVRTGADQCEDLLRAFDAEPWDVIVADGLSLGAHLASARTATPWVTVSIVPLAMPSPDLPPPALGLAPARGPMGRFRDRVLRRVIRAAAGGIERAYAEQRRRVGLPPTGLTFDEACYSPELVCASGVDALEYPRTSPAQQVVFVGELTPPVSEPQAMPDWWDDVIRSAAPIVHVTQGTQNVDPHDLIEPAVSALGRQQVQLVVSTGRRGEASLPFPVPSNARVADLVPYSTLLPRTDVMVTNGGWGGVLAALAHGVPLIVAGGDIDKPEIAARVTWAGAGVNLRTGRPSARAVLRAWRSVTTDASYRANARRIGALLREHDGPREVVEHTLALLGAKPDAP